MKNIKRIIEKAKIREFEKGRTNTKRYVQLVELGKRLRKQRQRRT